MSRETDSSSTGPQGRGGAAYPSGTPPYGTRQSPEDAAAPAPSPAPLPDEPKTETTLTTRIRINIPGSRPIPPVVMRTPMSDVDGGGGERTGSTPRPEAVDEPAPAPAPEPPAPAAGKPPTSDWFAPRRTGSAPPAAGSGAPDGPGAPAGPDASGTGGGQQRPDLPYFSDNSGRGASGPAPGAGGAPGPGFGAGLGAGPSGPTTGPATGSTPTMKPTVVRPDLPSRTGAGAPPRVRPAQDRLRAACRRPRCAAGARSRTGRAPARVVGAVGEVGPLLAAARAGSVGTCG
ncbi:hypothetical protein J0695_28495, partial [Streptomyces beijiangensis]|nr:hypothetical protein [Streptomyces beijiangensis]